jgi:hypothetical protein
MPTPRERLNAQVLLILFNSMPPTQVASFVRNLKTEEDDDFYALALKALLHHFRPHFDHLTRDDRASKVLETPRCTVSVWIFREGDCDPVEVNCTYARAHYGAHNFPLLEFCDECGGWSAPTLHNPGCENAP